MNLRDAAKSILQKTDTAMRRPEETSLWFARLSDSILAEVSQAEKAIGNRAGNEFQTSVADLKILAALARYHSWRQLAGLYFNLYKESGDLTSFDGAIANEKRAIQAWSEIVGAAGDTYSENLAFGVEDKGFPRHWKRELGFLEQDLRKLEAERQTAKGRAGAAPVRITVRGPNDKPPLAKLEPVSAAEPGRDVVVRAKVTAAAGVKWVRLRYRHLTQFEDYQTAEMRLDPQTGLHVGRIPASFIDLKWNLMYFVEVMDNTGFGRMYPDLEKDIPYVVVSVKR